MGTSDWRVAVTVVACGSRGLEGRGAIVLVTYGADAPGRLVGSGFFNGPVKVNHFTGIVADLADAVVVGAAGVGHVVAGPLRPIWEAGDGPAGTAADGRHDHGVKTRLTVWIVTDVAVVAVVAGPARGVGVVVVAALLHRMARLIAKRDR